MKITRSDAESSGAGDAASHAVPRWLISTVRLAAKALESPIAFAGLTKNGWSTCSFGGSDISTEHLVLLCDRVIAEGEFYSLADLSSEQDVPVHEIAHNGAPVRSLAGLAIRDDEGVTIGALCVADVRSRVYDEEDERLLRDIAALAGSIVSRGGSQRSRRHAGGQPATLQPSFLLRLTKELQVPLSEIAGFSDLVRREVVGESRRRAHTIHTHAMHVVETLRSVLDLVQIDSGAYAANPEALELAGQVREAVEAFRPKLRERGLWLKMETPPGTVEANIDRGALRRILRHVLSNAIRFTTEGGVSVEVRKEGSRAIIEVRDTGTGMTKEFLRTVFDVFEKSPEAESTGSGLGMAITKRLVNLSGGRITIDSTPGIGTSVFISFPTASAAREKAEATGERSAVRHDVSEKPSVLLVEDSPVTRRVIERILQDEYNVISVSEVDEAFAQAREHDLDILLLDIALNERRTGVEVLHGIRKMPRYADIPALACTAYSLPGIRDRYLEAGFNGYIAKPFRKEQLLDVMKQIRVAGMEPGTRVHETVDIGLPALPDTLPRLLGILNSEEAIRTDELAEILTTDPVVSAWVLRHVNSVFYSLRGKVTTVDRALTLLGAEPVANLVVAGLLARSFGSLDHETARDVYERILNTTLATAAFARELAQTAGIQNTETAFTAGLLHEIGRFCMLSHDPEKYSRLWHDGSGLAAPTEGQELLNFGIDHVSMGVKLARHWQLPDEFVSVIRYCEDPEKATPQHRSLVLIVAAAREEARELLREEANKPGESKAATYLRLLEQFHEVTEAEMLSCIDEKREHVRAFAEIASREQGTANT